MIKKRVIVRAVISVFFGVLIGWNLVREIGLVGAWIDGLLFGAWVWFFSIVLFGLYPPSVKITAKKIIQLSLMVGIPIALYVFVLFWYSLGSWKFAILMGVFIGCLSAIFGIGFAFLVRHVQMDPAHKKYYLE
ncbi:MAG: hypothetical protein Q7S57_03640 [bacterium]|nr:hypothetical protein [bacterium]